MKINRRELLDVLNVVKAGIAGKEILEQSSSFVFNGNRVYAFNDEIAVSAAIDIDFEGAVVAKELIAFLSKCKDKNIKIDEKDNELLLKGKNIKAGISIEKEIILPLDEISKAEEWHDLPSEFSRGVSLCQSSIGRDMTKPAFACLHLEGDIAEATDNQRISRFTFDDVYFEESVLIPYVGVPLLTQIPFVSYSVGQGWVHFLCEGSEDETTVLSCRTFESDYPDLEQFIDVKGKKAKLPKEIKETIERTSVFSNPGGADKEMVTVKLSKKQCQISSSNDVGWVKEKLDAKYKGKEFNFGICPHVLNQILDISNEAVVCSKTNTLRFERDNFVHVVTTIKGE